jgi:fructan beta-fructosidase
MMDDHPGYHFSPPAHWLNDPNGLVYHDGEYHLFYQYNPHDTVWGPMHWGHAVSRDLVHWQHLPIALYPDEHGMIFSGSAVVDEHNTAGFGRNALVAIFTYNKDRIETQNIAFSTDRGRTWEKYAGNPVIPHPGDRKDIRDPKVFWHNDHWVMVLAAGDQVLFYVSPNLKDWEVSGNFGGGFGSTDGVWETPDLFPLPVNASDSSWVLTVGVGNGAYAGGSGTQYFIGDFDGRTFTSLNPKETVLWMDHGADFYAPQSWNNEPNGRRITLGWMSNWQYARETPAETWRGMFSLPRELSLAKTENGLRLAQAPLRELKNLRDERYHWQNETLKPGVNLLEGITGDCFEILAELEINPQAAMVGFRLRLGETEYTLVGFDVQRQQLVLDRQRSGAVEFHESFAAMHSVKLQRTDDVLRLHIFLDRYSVEVFAEDGCVVMTDLIFPSASSRRLELFVAGGEIKLNRLDVYRLEAGNLDADYSAGRKPAREETN